MSYIKLQKCLFSPCTLVLKNKHLTLVCTLINYTKVSCFQAGYHMSASIPCTYKPLCMHPFAFKSLSGGEIFEHMEVSLSDLESNPHFHSWIFSCLELCCVSNSRHIYRVACKLSLQTRLQPGDSFLLARSMPLGCTCSQHEAAAKLVCAAHRLKISLVGETKHKVTSQFFSPHWAILMLIDRFCWR